VADLPPKARVETRRQRRRCATPPVYERRVAYDGVEVDAGEPGLRAGHDLPDLVGAAVRRARAVGLQDDEKLGALLMRHRRLSQTAAGVGWIHAEE
jgi:hypothetical protein